MDPVYGILVLAPLAVIVAIAYLFTRRRRKRGRIAPPVRPSSQPQTAAASHPAGIATTWAPPAGAHAPSPVAPTVVAPPGGAPSWDQPAGAQPRSGQATWGAPAAPDRKSVV
jgi:hypothetical protein